jgi:hypothetical protein
MVIIALGILYIFPMTYLGYLTACDITAIIRHDLFMRKKYYWLQERNQITPAYRGLQRHPQNIQFQSL